MELKQDILESEINFNTMYQKISTKIIIRVEKEFCLFSIKNDSDNMLKHRKLELLGGNMDIDSDESMMEALVRELEEEESSKLLSERAKKEAKKLDSIIIQGKKGLQLYNIYYMDITGEDYNEIKENFMEIESFGFVLLKMEHVEDLNWFSKNRAMFTPKTSILFSSMALSGSEFVNKLKPSK